MPATSRLLMRGKGFLLPGPAQKHHPVGVHLEPRVLRNHVQHDPIQVFRLEFPAGVFEPVVGLHRKADQHLPFGTPFAERPQNVRGPAQLDHRGGVSLRNLVRKSLHGRVIRDGGGHDDDIGLAPEQDRLVHLLGALHVDAFHARGCVEPDRTTHQRHPGTPPSRPPQRAQIPSCRTTDC